MSDSSAGQIVGGVAGAVVGFAAGGAVGAVQGFSLGYGIGGAIDPPEGPTVSAVRLEDLSFQSSTYGAPIPRIYGAVGAHGNVIYLENGKYKESVSTEDQGGKGGGGGASVETVTYFATFAVSICEAVDGAKISRLWLGGKLFFNADSGDIGTAVQSNKNAGSFKFYDGTQTEPDPRIESVVGIDNAESYEGTAYIIFYDLDLSEYGNGLSGCPVKVEISTNPQNQPVFLNSASQDFTGFGTFEPYPASLDVSGSVASMPNWDNIYPPTSERTEYRQDFDSAVDSRQSVVSPTGIPPSGLNDTGEIYNTIQELYGSFLDIRYPTGQFQIRNKRLSIIVLGNLITKYNNQEYQAPNAAGFAVCVDSDGVYTYTIDATKITRFDEGLNIVNTMLHGLSINPSVSAGQVGMYTSNGLLYVGYGLASGFTNYFSVSDDLTGLINEFTVPPMENQNGTMEFAVSNGVMSRFNVDRINSRVLFDSYSLSGVSSGGSALSDVVTKIVGDAGVEAQDIDTSDINGEILSGYIVTPKDARSALSSLQTAFLFDVIQDGYKLKVVKRGGEPVIEVPIGDLGAKKEGSATDFILSKSREMDTQLPSRIEVRYLDRAREYDTGSQYADFPTVAVNEKSIEVPIVLTSNQAARLADVLIQAAWIERDKFSFSLPQKYLELKVSDNIKINDNGRIYQIRLSSRSESQNQIINFTGSLSRPALYESDAVGADGVEPDETVNYLGDSEVDLIDAPMILNSLDLSGFVAAMNGKASWPGGSLFRSYDSGQTYSNIQSFVSSPPKGTAINTLSPSHGFVIERGTELKLNNVSGDFFSVSEAQLMSGSNWCFYGADGRWEVIRYMSAENKPDGSVVLSGFIRGHRGTEWATGLHSEGDVVIYVGGSASQFVGSEIDRIGMQSQYKAVTIGQPVPDAESFGFTYKGVNLKPLSPVIPLANKISDWIISCTTRTRYQGNFWVSGVQPQNESSLIYELDILNVDNVVRTIRSSSPDFVYTIAQQVEDFGSEQDEIKSNCYQVSSRVGRGRALLIEGSPSPVLARYWRMSVVQNQTGAGFTVCPEMQFFDSAGNVIPAIGAGFSSSNFSPSDGPANAFDGIPTTQWASVSSDASPFLGFVFDVGVSVASISWQGWHFTGQSQAAIYNAQFQVSDDGLVWQDIGQPITGETGWAAFEVRNFAIQ